MSTTRTSAAARLSTGMPATAAPPERDPALVVVTTMRGEATSKPPTIGPTATE